MKLYSYSSELLTFVEAKWIIVKFALGGILIAIIIFIGFIKLNQSVGFALGPRSAKTLAAENNFLRQQVSQISLRVSKMERQTRQLNEHADKIYMMFLQERKIAGDTVLSFASTMLAAGQVTKEFKPQISLISEAKIIHSPFQPRSTGDQLTTFK